MSGLIQSALTRKVDFNARILHVAIVAFVALVLQMTLNCLCAEGPIKVRTATWLDVIVVPRMFIAALIKEKGRWFAAYSILLLTSFLWIEWMVDRLGDWLG